MRTLSSFLVVSVLALASCTSILGGFDVNEGPPANTDTDGGTCTECGGQCVDLQTNTLNCGACGVACLGGQICKAAKCECADDKAFCNGNCVFADRQHCGQTCSVCANDQICSKGCIPAPSATFERAPRSPTGWVDADNKPLSFKIKSVTPGTTYECRTYSVYDSGLAPRAITPTDPPFKPCDGAMGTGLDYVPVEDPTVPQGSYRTEMRYRSDTYRSDPVVFDFYAHHKLDRVPTCPRAGKPTDGPHFTDAEYFAAALTYQQKNGTFDLTVSFPVPGVDPSTSELVLRNPFLKIPFKAAQRMPHNAQWAGTQFFDVTLSERSLRHQYTLNPTRTMILVKRQYEAPAKTSFGTHIPGSRLSGETDCKNLVKVGTKYSGRTGPDGLGRGKRYIDCEALILNSHGAALCMGPNAAGNAPEPQLVDTSADAGGYPYGTTAVAAAAGVTQITVNNINFMTSGAVGKYVQIPNRTGKYYQIVTVVNQTTVTITPGLAVAMPQGQPVRYSYAASPALTRRYIIPTGYAKFLEKNKGSQQTTGFYQPSYGTKCTSSPGCADGTTYLTYLPP